MVFQVNGESLLGARHKHAVNVIESLRGDVRFLVCDGYCDAVVPPQSPSATVDHGRGFVVQGHSVVTTEERQDHDTVTEEVSQGQGRVVQGHELESDINQGHGSVFQGHEVGHSQGPVVRGQDKVVQGQGPVLQGQDSESSRGSQGHGLQFQGHEMSSDEIDQDQGPLVQSQDKIVQGQGLVFEGYSKVVDASEPTVSDHHRERARQRRLARYCIQSYSTSCSSV